MELTLHLTSGNTIRCTGNTIDELFTDLATKLAERLDRNQQAGQEMSAIRARVDTFLSDGT